MTVELTLSEEATQHYLERGGACCPCCQSMHITGGFIEADAGVATQDVSCDECGARWVDLYGLKTVEMMSFGPKEGRT